MSQSVKEKTAQERKHAEVTVNVVGVTLEPKEERVCFLLATGLFWPLGTKVTQVPPGP